MRSASGTALLGLFAAVAGVGCAKRGPAAQARNSTVARLFPSEQVAHAPFKVLNRDGRSVLWKAPLVSAGGRVELTGLVRPAPDVPQAFRRAAPGTVGFRVVLPSNRPPVAASRARRVSVFAYFHEPQAGAPSARVELTLRRASGALATLAARAVARGAGREWRLVADLPEDQAGGEVVSLRALLDSFAGERVNVGEIEIAGPDERVPGAFLHLSQEGDARLAFVGGPGHALELSGIAAPGARLVGEVALADATATGAAVAEIVIATPGRESLRRDLRLEAAGGWQRYEVPIDRPAGTQVAVRLSLRGSARAAALWGEPMILTPAPAPVPRVVLISIDTLREDAVFPPGGREPLMPRLAARARREGQVVRNHYAASTWTLPSHASLLSGLYPSAHGVISPRRGAPLPAAHSLPAHFARSGLRTAAVTGGGFVSGEFGFASGFDRLLDLGLPPRELARLDAAYRALLPSLREGGFFLFLHSFFVHNYFDTDDSRFMPRLPPELAAWLEAERGGLVHRIQALAADPSQPHPPELSRVLRTLYAWRARAFDDWLDAFLSRVARDLPDPPPLVAITSDHGERFGEAPEGDWHHGGLPDERALRVPLLLLHPDRRPRPDVVELTSAVDLAPTLARLAGLPRAAGSGSGVDLLDAGETRRRAGVLAESTGEERDSWAFVAAQRKAIAATRWGGPSVEDEWSLLSGVPGRYVPAPAGEAARQRAEIEAWRRRQVTDDASGDFVEIVNPGSRDRRLDLDLGVPFQPFFLEAGDAVVPAAARGETRLRLRLAPGDRELFVARAGEPGALRVGASDGPVVVEVAGRRVDASRPLLIGAGAFPPQAAPAAEVPAGRAVLLRVWSNRGRGAQASGAAQAPEPGAGVREQLRALGYLD